MSETNTRDPLDDKSLSIYPHKLCRSCLCELSRDYFCLEGSYLERKLVDILRDLISMEIELNDGLPSKLCPTCYDHIIRFDVFKSKVLETEKLLANKVVVIEKAEIDYDDQSNKDDLQGGDENCDTKPAIKTEPDILSPSSEEHSDGPGSLPKVMRKRRISRKIFKQKSSDIPSAGRQKRERRREACSVCEKVVFAYKMESHMRTHTKEKPYGCKKCGTSFADKSNLNRHMKTHEAYRPYRCELCGKGFLRPSSKEMHLMTTHRSERDVLCHICSKAFKHQCFLTKHMANIHNKPEVKVKVERLAYQCPICDQFYSSKSSLSVHKMKHKYPRAHLCTICGRTYSTKAVLDNHQKVHTGEKSLVCNVCNKSFRYKSTLNTHVLVHSGEKPLACHICNKQFRQHAHLNTHIKGQHSANRPFKCTFCSKTFKQSCNLTVHTRIHTGETPYRCDLCLKGFYDSSSLKKHKKKSHTENGGGICWDNVEMDITKLENETVK